MPELRVAVVSPEREVFDGEAELVIARTLEGELGVLAGHAPLAGVLAIGVVYVVTAEGREAIAVDGGFLTVRTEEGRTQVTVLAEHAQPASELASEDVQRFEDEAQRLAGEDPVRAQEAAAKASSRRQLIG